MVRLRALLETGEPQRTLWEPTPEQLQAR
jgi:hypothetical protein